MWYIKCFLWIWYKNVIFQYNFLEYATKIMLCLLQNDTKYFLLLRNRHKKVCLLSYRYDTKNVLSLLAYSSKLHTNNRMLWQSKIVSYFPMLFYKFLHIPLIYMLLYQKRALWVNFTQPPQHAGRAVGKESLANSTPLRVDMSPVFKLNVLEWK